MSRAQQFLLPTYGGGGIVVILITFSSGEEGDVDNNTVEITFSTNVNSPGADYAAGVTIKINAVAATINSADRQTDHTLVYYVLDEDIDINDVVTWEYDDDFGDLEAETGGSDLADVEAQATTNYVGAHHYFDEEWDSGHHAEI